jgi:enoyl-CoA hydratase
MRTEKFTAAVSLAIITIATITIDDGKVNALSLAVLTELNAALDQAEQDDAVVILARRDGVFSAGFDLPVLRGTGPDALAMLRAGLELAARLLAFPRPVVIACTGHVVAMGVFLLSRWGWHPARSGPGKCVWCEFRVPAATGGGSRHATI